MATFSSRRIAAALLFLLVGIVVLVAMRGVLQDDRTALTALMTRVAVPSIELEFVRGDADDDEEEETNSPTPPEKEEAKSDEDNNTTLLETPHEDIGTITSPPTNVSVSTEAVEDEQSTTNDTDFLPPTMNSTEPPFPHSTTIVTAYFNVNDKAKHSVGEYMTWCEPLLSLQSPMVIFTNMEPTVFEPVRRHYDPDFHLTRFVYLDFRSLNTTMELGERIAQLMKRDMQQNVNSAGLYAVWYAKPEFLRRAMDLPDAFPTPKYAWLDIGLIRDIPGVRRADFMGTAWPHPNKVGYFGRDGRVTFANAEAYLPPCGGLRWVQPPHLRVIPLNSRLRRYSRVVDVPEILKFLAGGLWGGSREALDKYIALYERELRAYLWSERPKYNLADQHIFGAIACVHPELVEVVRACGCGDSRSWFFLLRFLHTPGKFNCHCRDASLAIPERPFS